MTVAISRSFGLKFSYDTIHSWDVNVIGLLTSCTLVTTARTWLHAEWNLTGSWGHFCLDAIADVTSDIMGDLMIRTQLLWVKVLVEDYKLLLITSQDLHCLWHSAEVASLAVIDGIPLTVLYSYFYLIIIWVNLILWNLMCLL